jgi:hypothetical protein
VPQLVADLPVNPGSTSQPPARSGRTHNTQREPPANPTPTPSPSSPRLHRFFHTPEVPAAPHGNRAPLSPPRGPTQNPSSTPPPLIQPSMAAPQPTVSAPAPEAPPSAQVVSSLGRAFRWVLPRCSSRADLLVSRRAGGQRVCAAVLPRPAPVAGSGLPLLPGRQPRRPPRPRRCQR